MRTDHEKERVCRDCFLGAAGTLAKHELLEPPIASTSDDLGSKADLDRRIRLDLPNQVVGHTLRKAVGSHDERDRSGVMSEVKRRLAG